MVKSPLVSVVIPTFNEEKYIENTLKSLKNQTYSPLEIIVVDSFSTDNTLKIVKKYTNKIFKKNTNIAEAKNMGAAHANGYVLVFLDADTVLSTNWIGKAVKNLEDGAVMSVGIFRDLENKWRYQFLSAIWSDVLPTFLRKFGIVGHAGASTFAVKKEFFRKAGGFNNKLVAFEDVDFCRRISKYGNVRFDRSCVVLTSMRRFNGIGLIKWSFLWFMGGSLALIFRDLRIKKYKAIR